MDAWREYFFVIEWLGLLSAVTFVGSLVAIPFIIARLPHDYFIRHRLQVEQRHRQHPVKARLVFLLRNGTGGILLVAGIAMLVLPGQGIITILIGICLMDFPGKHALIDSLVRRPNVIHFLNWIRKKEKKTPFAF